MKRTLFIFSTFLFLLVSTHAHALLNGSRITSVTKINDQTCAITLDANGSGLLDILSTDQLQLNGSLLANLGALVERLLSLDLNVVHEVLVASPAFETLTGLTADIHIDNDDCIELQVGDVLQIAVPGLLGGFTILDSVTLPSGFDDLTSILIDDNGNISLLDLVEDVLEIIGLETEGTIGGGNGNVGNPPAGQDPDDSGVGGDNGGEDGGVVGELPGNAASGGCSLGASTPAAGLGLLAWVGAAAAFVTSRKRR